MNDVNHTTQLTRSKIIITIANQDGGAHFDENIDSLYKNITSGDTGISLEPSRGTSYLLGYDSTKAGKPIHFKDLTLAYMREIVHETILSLQSYYGLSNIPYTPNFKYNWSRRINYMAWQFGLKPE